MRGVRRPLQVIWQCKQRIVRCSAHFRNRKAIGNFIMSFFVIDAKLTGKTAGHALIRQRTSRRGDQRRSARVACRWSAVCFLLLVLCPAFNSFPKYRSSLTLDRHLAGHKAANGKS